MIIESELPLYVDSDYDYEIPLEDDYYSLRLYFNERMQAWMYELRSGENELLVGGGRLVPYFAILAQYEIGLKGALWLESIGDDKNQTMNNPFDMKKYYKLFYIYNKE